MDMMVVLLILVIFMTATSSVLFGLYIKERKERLEAIKKASKEISLVSLAYENMQLQELLHTYQKKCAELSAENAQLVLSQKNLWQRLSQKNQLEDDSTGAEVK